MDKVYLYDTTLRDGTQREGISLSVDDKLKIAKRLDDFGFHYIEGGWPGSNPKDAEFFIRAQQINFKHAKLAAFGATLKKDKRPEDDLNIQMLLEAGTPVVIVEAMKMQNELASLGGGTVKDILVKAGDVVESRQTLLVIDRGEE